METTMTKLAMVAFVAMVLGGCMASDEQGDSDSLASQESAVESPPAPEEDMHGQWNWRCKDSCDNDWSRDWRACDAANHSGPDDYYFSICEQNALTQQTNCYVGCDLIFQGL